MHNSSIVISRYYVNVYVSSFLFLRTAVLWNSLPAECFLWPLILMVLSLEFIGTFIFGFFLINFRISSFSSFFSCNSMPNRYGVHHRKVLWSSYRKLAWVGFEPTTNGFRSDVLTDWAIRPWVQLALRAKFIQLLQFHLLPSVCTSFRLLPSLVTTFMLIEILHRLSHEFSGMNWDIQCSPPTESLK